MNTIPLELPTGEVSANNPLPLNQPPLFSLPFVFEFPSIQRTSISGICPSAMLVWRNALGNVPWPSECGKHLGAGSLVGSHQVPGHCAGSSSVTYFVHTLPLRAFITHLSPLSRHLLPAHLNLSITSTGRPS